MSGIRSKLRRVFDEHSSKNEDAGSNGRRSLEATGSPSSNGRAGEETSFVARKPVARDDGRPSDTPSQSRTSRATSGQDARNQSLTQTDDFSDMRYLAPAVQRMSLEDSEDKDPSYQPGYTPSRNFVGNDASSYGTSTGSPARTSADPQASYSSAAPRASSGQTSPPGVSHRVKRSSLDKALPTTPTYASTRDQPLDAPSPSPPNVPVHNAAALAKSRGQTVQDVERDLGVSNVIDLSNTVETHIHESIAPAVVHETITQPIHHIREEVITREIHQDHIIHRVLPIEDFEILPARHYIQDATTGGFREVPESQVPGRARASRHAEKLVAKAYKKTMPRTTEQSKGPRQFTARKFEGTDGDYREGKSSTGTEQTERWWIHAPELETGGEQSEQTFPFHFESEDPRDDGLRMQKVAI